MSKKITLSFETGNAAFEGYEANEAAEVLQRAVLLLRSGGALESYHNLPLRDYNGNPVGKITVEEI